MIKFISYVINLVKMEFKAFIIVRNMRRLQKDIERIKHNIEKGYKIDSDIRKDIIDSSSKFIKTARIFSNNDNRDHYKGG